MSVNTQYYAVPTEFAERIREDEGLTEVFLQIYGCGSSLKDFFTETDQEEIDEITEDLPEKDIESMRLLLNETDFGESAYSENTFDIHIKGLTSYLELIGENDAAKLSSTIICGDIDKLSDFIQGSDKERQKRITEILANKGPEVFSHYDLQAPYSDPEWSKEIAQELEEIIKCYISATEMSGEVWIGCL